MEEDAGQWVGEIFFSFYYSEKMSSFIDQVAVKMGSKIFVFYRLRAT